MPKKNPKLNGCVYQNGGWFRKVSIPLGSKRYKQLYINLGKNSNGSALSIKEAEIRNAEVNHNIEKVQVKGKDFQFYWMNAKSKNRILSDELSSLHKKFMEYKRGEGLTKGSLEFYRITYDSLMDIQNYFETDWKPDFIIRTMRDRHIEDIKKYFMMRVDARENGAEGIKGISRATVSIRYRNLRTFFDWLVEKDIINRAPKLVIKGIPPKEPKLFTDTEIDMIYEHILKSNKYHNYLADVYRFYVETGLRLSEPFYATINGNILTVRKTKGDAGRGRKVALESHHVETLNELEKHTKQYYSKMFHRIISDLGIKNDRSFHNLRDTWITKTWYLTGDIHLTSKLVGHSSISMTQAYCNFHPEELETYFPSIQQKKVETQQMLQAMKEFELNPYKIVG